MLPLNELDELPGPLRGGILVRLHHGTRTAHQGVIAETAESDERGPALLRLVAALVVESAHVKRARRLVQFGRHDARRDRDLLLFVVLFVRTIGVITTTTRGRSDKVDLPARRPRCGSVSFRDWGLARCRSRPRSRIARQCASTPGRQSWQIARCSSLPWQSAPLDLGLNESRNKEREITMLNGA